MQPNQPIKHLAGTEGIRPIMTRGPCRKQTAVVDQRVLTSDLCEVRSPRGRVV